MRTKKIADKKTKKFPTKAAAPAVAKKVASSMPMGRPDMPLANTPEPQPMM